MSEANERRISPRAIHGTALLLLVLWGGSWALSYVQLGSMALPVAMAIAVVKAVLVLFVFMELSIERFSIRATVMSAAALVVVFIFLTVVDVGTREVPLRPPSTSAASPER